VHEDAYRVDIGIRENHVQQSGVMQHHRPEEAAGSQDSSGGRLSLRIAAIPNSTE
jgi:hypothetical protein